MKFSELYESPKKSVADWGISKTGKVRMTDKDSLVIRSGTVFSLVGCPEEVGSIDVFGCDIVTLEGMPRRIRTTGVFDKCKKLRSLHNIHEHVDFVGNYLSFGEKTFIQSHVLGLLKIDGLRSVWPSTNFTVFPLVGNTGNRTPSPDDRMGDAFHIVNKYLPKGNIYDCQAELIEYNLKEYAQL